MKIVDKIRRRLINWLLPSNSPAGTPLSHADSLTGGDENYLEVCRMACVDPAIFGNFRRNPGYTTALEHVSETQGREYFRLLTPGGRAKQNIGEAARNDAIGNPVTMRLDSGLRISPTTLRYLKVADDLERFFGNLDGADIVEIGIGYGGQCRVVDSLFKLKSYTLVDLRPVLDLASEFLSHFPLRCAVRFLTMNELAPRPYDLVLSNYAFSELSRELQETYYLKAMQQTPRGYVTYNDIAPAEYRSFTCDEIRERFSARVLPEEPLTHPKNRIVVWGAAF